MSVKQELCPICNKMGKQTILDGFLCYIHKKEKCCRWGKVVDLGNVLQTDEDNELLLFINIDLKYKNKKLCRKIIKNKNNIK